MAKPWPSSVVSQGLPGSCRVACPLSMVSAPMIAVSERIVFLHSAGRTDNP